MQKKIKNKNYRASGFTLIEMVVATSIFVIVMVVAAGAIMSITNANRKSQSSKVAIDSLSFALDDMSRHIRVGTSYSCSDVPSDKDNCSYSDGDGGNTMSFKFKDPATNDPPYVISYKFDNADKMIKVKENNDADWSPLTSSDIIIDYAHSKFYVEGASGGDDKQPRVIIMIKGETGGGDSKYKDEFSMQTSVTQRVLDQ